jgi:hypothetical protein
MRRSTAKESTPPWGRGSVSAHQPHFDSRAQPNNLADPPTAYISLVEQLDPSRSESITLSAIQRMLGTSELSGSTVEKVSGRVCIAVFLRIGSFFGLP